VQVADAEPLDFSAKEQNKEGEGEHAAAGGLAGSKRSSNEADL
jgi:hypothetical protein